ncbi:unnamed protein product [Caenorhabditis angaria]|uniref:Uncharacterized protein n=1 Tax=Caenorhabditis angaria TaxID=860376 RepID=A0A9P1N728_9PELO|nr:unnamed protein product [Caenorhabditis angaria]
MVHSINSGLVFFTNIESNFLSPQYLTHLLAIYGGSLYISTSFLAVMFIHRYYSIVKPEQLFYFQGRRITLWISYSSLIGLSCYLSNIYLGSQDEFSSGYVAWEIMKIYNLVIRETPAIIIIVFGDNEEIRWGNLMYLISNVILIALQNAIIIYCGCKIRRKLYSKNTNYSASLRKLHSQFYKTLVFQVLAPTFVIILPTLVILSLPFFHFQTSSPIGALMCLFELYPAIDSLIVMYIITDYNKAIKGLKFRIIRYCCCFRFFERHQTLFMFMFIILK